MEPEQIVSTFTADLADIRKQTYRADLTPGLTRHYRALVTSLKDVGAVVEYTHDREHVVVDEAFQRSFEVALKERVVEDVTVTGHLDAVNAHKSPFVFYLYPKLEEADRVECFFPADMLQSIAALLKRTRRAPTAVQSARSISRGGIHSWRMTLRMPPGARRERYRSKASSV